MGHWILSQCDTYTPAASAACQAFQAAFSPAKQPEALSFCKDEILTVSGNANFSAEMWILVLKYAELVHCINIPTLKGFYVIVQLQTSV